MEFQDSDDVSHNVSMSSIMASSVYQPSICPSSLQSSQMVHGDINKFQKDEKIRNFEPNNFNENRTSLAEIVNQTN